ncbi:MAG: double-strand break repair protein AddB, partial [Pseudomonadota bacterium]
MSGEVLTVACGQPFLKVLARGLLDGCFAPAGSSPDVLAETTVLLPTRRACRTLSTLLLEEADRSAVLMPRIRPLVPGEDGAAGLAGDATFSSFFSAPSASQSGDVVQEDTGEITPAIPQLERRLVLMQFVMRWLASARVEAAGRASGYDAADLSAVTPAQALRLADDLAALMDEVTEEGADLTRLAADLPVEFASHWQRTLEFLAIMTETFPAYLLATDRVTSSTHAAQTLARDAEHTRKHGLTAPVVIAGIASVRALAAPLIAAVAEDDHGVIILPGLDRELDRETWNALAGERDGMQGLQEAQPEHPQAGIARLLSTMGRKRDDVGDLFLRDGRATIMRADSEAHDPPRETPRVRLLSEALLPADVTDHWQTLATRFSGDDVALALDGLEVIETAGIDEEADVAALILREAIETPEATAVLVTPDRAIARRVRQRLERWGIFVDDTAGRPLGQTVPGTFLDLIVACIDSQFAPSATMALLQHPLTRLGLDRGVVREAARALELLAFRQTYLGAGLAAMRAALTRASVSPVGDTTFVHPVIERLSSEARAAADDLLVQIEAAVAPMMDIDTSGEEMPLRAHVRAHVEVAEAFARDAAGDSSNLWQGDAGEAACTLLSEVLGDDSADVPLVAGDYSSVFRALFAGEVVRPRRPGHPRIAIYGVLEARLQHADTVVLAGLNEGTWPKPADPDPWVNRPMRAEVGLPAPEVRIGQAAHDFVQLASGLSVVLTRSARVDGVPTVPSRWLMRLEAVLGGLAAAYPQSGAQDVFGKATTRAPALRWARAFREVPAHAPRPAPAPSPPV